MANLRYHQLLLKDKALLLENEVKKTTENLEKREFETLIILGNAAEYKDPETGNHVSRVAHYSRMLAISLNQSEEEQDNLYYASPLHDVGKIGIPDSILLKPGPLTPDEFVIIKTHPEVGENICRPLKSLQNVLPVIRHHQERHNGSGYPDSLKGSEIPIHARIIGIVDCFDALTTERTYRRALPTNVAIEIIEKETDDGLWDPELVKILKSIVKKKEFEKWNILSKQSEQGV